MTGEEEEEQQVSGVRSQDKGKRKRKRSGVMNKVTRGRVKEVSLRGEKEEEEEVR